MKKTNVIILLFSLLVGIELCSAITLDNYNFCRIIWVSDWDNYSKPITCEEETSEFSTTDPAVYILIKLSSLTEGDEVVYEVKDPSGEIIPSEEPNLVVTENLTELYDFKEIKIAGQNRQTGEYPVKLYINSQEVASDKFTIKEEVPETCENLGLYCCPPSKICLSAQNFECESGTCCESEDDCKNYSPSYLTRTEITNCEDKGLKDCGNVLKLYEYNVHATISPEQTAVIYYKGVDVDCGDRTDVAIAYYDEKLGYWVEKLTNVEEGEAEDSYKATAMINYLGYLALIRTKECVPLLCTYGGYRTDPIGGYVNFGEDMTFELCGMVSGCEAIKNKKCNKKCPEGIDPDCGECTPAKDDCCLISYDGLCDLDCASNVDPDCCDKSKELCCPADAVKSGSQGCDKNCGTSDVSCSGCTNNGGDCCNSAEDGVCDPDCPKLSNGVGYLDTDCCTPNGVSISSSKGDCCNNACDGICDPDCIVGVDPDCNGLGCCGDDVCQTSSYSYWGFWWWWGGYRQCYPFTKTDCNEDCSTCPQDCGVCWDYSHYYYVH